MAKRVLVIGLDGLEPKLVEALLEAGDLPNLARLRERGGYGRLGTTLPAQTPVAWSSFAVGTNPGGHGIFDFIRRDPTTYLPDLALNRYEQKSAFLPPKAVNLRRGTPVWRLLSDAGIASTVIRCPCTYPPDDGRGRMLSGMGVPDLRGGLGTSTFYTSAGSVPAGESETVVPVRREGAVVRTRLIGPRNPKTGEDGTLDVAIEIDAAGGRAVLRSDGAPRELELRPGEWSDWLHVKFKFGLLQAVRGMVRLLLVRLEPEFELYASPVNFDPAAPLFPISSPWEYAGELEKRLGTYYTTGMVEDHTGLNNERFDEAAYLDQCAQVLREREAMLQYELDRFDEGLLYCLFDTPDRIQHMFWRFREADHPAHRGRPPDPERARVIEDHYRECDAIVGRALARVDDDTLCIVLSDHGFTGFRRGVHLNTWLHDNGFLALAPGAEPGEGTGDLLKAVDWSRTRAYALGLGSIYLNLKGREAEGTVAPEEADGVKAAIAGGLTGLIDPARGAVAVRAVAERERAYAGPCMEDAPDLIVRFADGYRASWATGLGGVPAGIFEDNVKRWSGDHIVDPQLVPGVLFMSRTFRGAGASLLDLAPTILAALGVPKGADMEGESLLP